MKRTAFNIAASTVMALCASGAAASPFLLTGLEFDFGDVHVGDQTQAQVVTLTNTTDTARTFSLAGGAPFDNDFSAAQNCVNLVLAPGASCDIQYRFKPARLGDSTTTSVLSIDGESRTVTLHGTGISPYLLSAQKLDFGTVAVGGTSASQTVQLTNVSQSTRSFSLAGGAPFDNDFSAAQNCVNRLLAPGEACQFTYRFSPDADGGSTTTSRLSIEGETIDIGLAGFGGDTPQHPFLVSGLDLHFGDEHVGDTTPVQEVKITNISEQTLTPDIAGGAPFGNEFRAAQNCVGRSFAPGDSCSLFFSYAPLDTTADSSQSIFSIDGVVYQIALSGSGLDPFLIPKLSLDFGDVALGELSLFQTVLLMNVSQTARSFGLAGGAPFNNDFSAAQNCVNRVLAPGASCEFIYGFRPQTAGFSETLSNLSVNGKLVSIALQGTGIGDGTPPNPMPLPGTLPLVGAGFLAWGVLRSRRGQHRSSARYASR